MLILKTSNDLHAMDEKRKKEFKVCTIIEPKPPRVQFGSIPLRMFAQMVQCICDDI